MLSLHANKFSLADDRRVALVHSNLNPLAKSFVPHLYLSTRHGVDITNANFENCHKLLIGDTPQVLQTYNRNSSGSLSSEPPNILDISTPAVSEADSQENIQNMQPFCSFCLFCYILSASLHISMCIPSLSIQYMHDGLSFTSTTRENMNFSPFTGDHIAMPNINKNPILWRDNVPLNNIGNSDPYTILKNIKMSNINRLIIGQLNINSLRSQLEALKSIMTGNIDILIITESKLDETFPNAQFLYRRLLTSFPTRSHQEWRRDHNLC